MYRRLGLLVLSVGLALTVMGCGKNMKSNEYQVRSTQEPAVYDGNMTGTMHNVETDNISQQVLKVNNVNKATVFVHGNNVVTGIDVKENANQEAVENEVRQTIEKAYPQHKVHVTANKDFHNRIMTIQSQMVPMDGHPVQNLTQDIEVLLNDMGRAITAPLR